MTSSTATPASREARAPAKRRLRAPWRSASEGAGIGVSPSVSRLAAVVLRQHGLGRRARWVATFFWCLAAAALAAVRYRAASVATGGTMSASGSGSSLQALLLGGGAWDILPRAAVGLAVIAAPLAAALTAAYRLASNLREGKLDDLLLARYSSEDFVAAHVWAAAERFVSWHLPIAFFGALAIATDEYLVYVFSFRWGSMLSASFDIAAFMFASLAWYLAACAAMLWPLRQSEPSGESASAAAFAGQFALAALGGLLAAAAISGTAGKLLEATLRAAVGPLFFHQLPLRATSLAHLCGGLLALAFLFLVLRAKGRRARRGRSVLAPSRLVRDARQTWEAIIRAAEPGQAEFALRLAGADAKRWPAFVALGVGAWLLWLTAYAGFWSGGATGLIAFAAVAYLATWAAPFLFCVLVAGAAREAWLDPRSRARRKLGRSPAHWVAAAGLGSFLKVAWLAVPGMILGAIAFAQAERTAPLFGAAMSRAELFNFIGALGVAAWTRLAAACWIALAAMSLPLRRRGGFRSALLAGCAATIAAQGGMALLNAWTLVELPGRAGYTAGLLSLELVFFCAAALFAASRRGRRFIGRCLAYGGALLAQDWGRDSPFRSSDGLSFSRLTLFLAAPGRKGERLWPRWLLVWGGWLALYAAAAYFQMPGPLLLGAFLYGAAVVPLHIVVGGARRMNDWRRAGLLGELSLACHPSRGIAAANYAASAFRVLFLLGPGLLLAGPFGFHALVQLRFISGMSMEEVLFFVLATGALVGMHVLGASVAGLSAVDWRVRKGGWPLAQALAGGFVVVAVGAAMLALNAFVLRASQRYLPDLLALIPVIASEACFLLLAIAIAAWRWRRPYPLVEWDGAD